MRTSSLSSLAVLLVAGMSLAPAVALAQKSYDAGVTDTEIKVGNIMAYSGPASAYGTVGKAMAAYFKKVNDEGGVNGRKINFVSLDDAYNPPKTVEAARRLIEQEEVLLIVSPLGTAPNAAIVKYMNQKKVPQLFVSSGASRWGDYKEFPWTMGWQPTYAAEGSIYAKHILANVKEPKIGILYQNDDLGRDFINGLMEGLSDKKGLVVSQQSYAVTDPTVDSQIVSIKSSGANVFVNVTTPKFAAMAIRKLAELGWKPEHYLSSVSQSIGGVLKPAGFDNARGLISVTYLRDPTDSQWKDSPEVAEYSAWFQKYFQGSDISDQLNVSGYSYAQTLVEVLRRAGDNLTRKNILNIATNLRLKVPMLYPGIEVETGPDDYYPVEKMQPVRFNGSTYEPLGSVLGK